MSVGFQGAGGTGTGRSGSTERAASTTPCETASKDESACSSVSPSDQVHASCHEAFLSSLVDGTGAGAWSACSSQPRWTNVTCLTRLPRQIALGVGRSPACSSVRPWTTERKASCCWAR